jgi:hypothetical protein
MSPLSSIERQLQQRFAAHGEAGRIVVWSDPEGEYADALDALDLPDVTVLRVAGNEFDIKRRVLSTEPKTRFLIYRPTPSPADPLENWLLDLELAYGLFTTDSTSLVVQEFGSGQALRKVVERYPAFFKADKRKTALKARIDADDDETDITAKMVAVIVDSEGHSLDALWRSLLIEDAQGKSASMDEITKLGLGDFHWAGTRRIYGYNSDNPAVDDFVLWLFARAWERFASTTPNKFRNIQRDFSTWSNDVRFADTYQSLADRAAAGLDIATKAKALDLPGLMPSFTFREVDQQIIARLVQGVENRT